MLTTFSRLEFVGRGNVPRWVTQELSGPFLGHLGDLGMAISNAWVPWVTQKCAGTAYLTPISNFNTQGEFTFLIRKMCGNCVSYTDFQFQHLRRVYFPD